jgi:mannose-6-phosphate isomerase-like protein (cupin superfamily)
MLVTNKPWGKEEILEANDKYVVKRLHMHEGKRCSLQYHERKTETIYVLKGTLLIITQEWPGEDTIITTLKPGDTYTIVPEYVHRMAAKEDSVYLECSTTELDDVVRIEDDYGRT